MAKAAQMVRGRAGVPAHLCSSPLSHLPQRGLQFNSGGSLPCSYSPHFTDEERVRLSCTLHTWEKTLWLGGGLLASFCMQA